jgi:hypothetical protein
LRGNRALPQLRLLELAINVETQHHDLLAVARRRDRQEGCPDYAKSRERRSKRHHAGAHTDRRGLVAVLDRQDPRAPRSTERLESHGHVSAACYFLVHDASLSSFFDDSNPRMSI